MTNDSGVGGGRKKAPKRVDSVLVAFGDNLLRFRKKASLTQEELAGAIGLCRVAIANMEAGNSRTTIEHILRLCAVLKVTPNELLPPIPKITMKKVVIARRVVEKQSIEAKFKW
jgi:transcriptional regulator with XRE-family HTH domain